MNHLFNFKIDKNKASYQVAIDLKMFIENFVINNYFFNLCNEFSKITNIPIQTIQNKTKIILSSNFDFNTGKFRSKFSFLNFTKDALSYLWILFCCFFPNFKKRKKIIFDIIFDDVDNSNVFTKFNKLVSLFKSHLFITNNKISHKTLNLFYFNKKILFFDQNYLKGKKLLFFKFFLIILFKSIKLKINFFTIFNVIFFQTLKYETVFNKVNSKLLITMRPWKTCPIKNFLYKKHGGKISSSFQTNILEASISLFIFCDTLFTLGDDINIKKTVSDLGGNINSYIPIGSISMQSCWFDSKKDVLNLPDVDILVIGINPSSCLKINNRVMNNYFEHIKWIKRFSDDYKNLKILLKHHEYRLHKSSTDPIIAFERDIFKNSNVNITIKSNSINGSYGYFEKSKVIVSFGSTMILEGLSHNKKCFFLDPNLDNSAFFQNFSSYDSLRIGTYEDFKSKMISSLSDIETKDHTNANNDIYCLKSNKVTDKIYDFYHNYK